MRYLFIVLALLLTSCMSVEKATSYLKKEGALAEVCSEAFPIQEKVIQGETIVVTDSILVAGDSVECEPAEKPFKVKCPDSKVEVRHSFRVDTLVQENTAKTDMYKTYYEKQLQRADQLEEKLSAMKDSRNKYRVRFWGLIILLGGGILGYLFINRYIPFL